MENRGDNSARLFFVPVAENVFAVNDKLADDGERNREEQEFLDHRTGNNCIAYHSHRDDIINEVEENPDKKKLRKAFEVF